MKPEITPRFYRSREDSWVGRFISRLDWSLLLAAVLLSLMGLFFIYSATHHGSQGYAYLIRQSAALLAGLVGMTVFVLLPYQVFSTYARWIYGISVILLIGVLVFGVRLRGSKSWFDFHWFYFQPVEVARLALAIGLSAYADAHFRRMGEWQGLLTPLLMTGLFFGLVLLQPDLSSALVMGPMALAVLYTAGVPVARLASFFMMAALALGIPLASTYFHLAGDRFQTPVMSWVQRAFLERTAFFQLWGGVCAVMCLGWWFLRKWRIPASWFTLACSLAVVVSGVGGSFVVEKVLKEYHRKRLIAFVDPGLDPLGAGYNILQSEIAIGSGRFFGKGYLSGTQAQLGFLPEQHTDFIFSLISEEMGFVGASLVLLLYFWVVWRAFDIAASARDRFGRFLAVALGTFFAFSGVVNIGMVMGLMPVTGLPLPFLSYGGSALVGTFLAVGFLLSIHVRRFIL